MSNRKIAITVGILFLVQMITFMSGNIRVQSFLNGEASKDVLLTGVLLEVVSGVSVVIIGLLMYQVLKVVHQKLALAYPVFRVIEFAVSALLGIYLLNELHAFPNHILWVYLPTAIGGLVLSYLLYISRIVPRPIALLGLFGYLLLLLGVPLDLFGVVDIDKGLGLALLAPGGLFEFLFFPAWLIFKGFRPSVRFA